MAKLRRTKIIATLGPASSDRLTLTAMLAAGVNLLRINFSHGDADQQRALVSLARECAEAVGHEIGILGDLQGPKIRIGRFKQQAIYLETGADFILDAELDSNAGCQQQVGIDYKALPEDVRADDILLLDDGLIRLQVKSVIGKKIHCEVIDGGRLSNNKGINRLGGGLSAKALTEKDKLDLQMAIDMQLDYIAISFARDAEDIHEARHMIAQANANLGVIAKIERSEAVGAMDDIIRASDAVMVARGDLAIEIGAAEVPAVQKTIIRRARYLDKAVITATQMMESMVEHPVPTRAEVSDVANAVLDGTDAVMLSAETAVGKYPVKVVNMLNEICLSAESHPLMHVSSHRLEAKFKRVDEAIAMATMYTANHLGIKAICALTESGSTPLWMSRIRSGIPIYGLSRHLSTRRKMTLFRGVYPVAFDPMTIEHKQVTERAMEKLHQLKLVDVGDLLIITKGNHMGEMGGTNALKIVTVV